MWPQTPSLKRLIYLRLPWMQEAKARCLSIRNTPFMRLLMALDIFHMAVQCSVESPRIISPLLRTAFSIAYSVIAQHVQGESLNLYSFHFFNVSFVLLIMFWLSQGCMPWTKSHMCITNCVLLYLQFLVVALWSF